MATDLVCGMEIDEAIAEHKYDYEGNAYFFCGPGCKTEFETNPENFIGGDATESEMEIPSQEKKKPWWKFW